jgi:hypothetical protein
MPGDPGGPVVTTLVCFLFSHARLRVHWAPGIPHALLGEECMQDSGVSRRENADLCFVIASHRSRECAPDDGLREAIHFAT